jgi:hypothetical protein
MNKEFNLSEKEWYDGAMYLYNKEDVKEFIRLLKENIVKQTSWNGILKDMIFEEIDKLAGDKLT